MLAKGRGVRGTPCISASCSVPSGTCHTAAAHVLPSAQESCPWLVGTAPAAKRMKQSLQTLQLALERRWPPGC